MLNISAEVPHIWFKNETYDIIVRLTLNVHSKPELCCVLNWQKKKLQQFLKFFNNKTIWKSIQPRMYISLFVKMLQNFDTQSCKKMTYSLFNQVRHIFIISHFSVFLQCLMSFVEIRFFFIWINIRVIHLGFKLFTQKTNWTLSAPFGKFFLNSNT